MMTLVPQAAGESARLKHLPHSVPGEETIRAFLLSGALLAWSEDRWIIAWGDPVRAARPHPEQPSFYAPDFYLRDPAPWRIYPHAAAVTPDSLAQQMQPRAVPRIWRHFKEDLFAAAFARVQGELAAGRLGKAVPAVFETDPRPLDAADRERALRSLANLPSGLMPYGCWDAAGGMVGASPELLFENDGVEIHTVAVAGTARADSTPEEMMEDPKERTEHRLVLDDVAEQLSTLGRVTKGATRLWRVGMLSHLRTDLRVTPGHAVTFDELVGRLHPTPAVGMSPRAAWRELLPQIDTAPRGFFGAPFGLVLPGGAARCLVAIRQVQWDENGSRCGAGCGLVPGSKLERELAELHLKLSASRGNLGL